MNGTRYESVRQLAIGGMAEILLAYDNVARRDVVLKRIRPDMVHDPLLLSLFRTEANIGARLHHRNIVEVLGFEQTPSPTIVMEYLRGDELSQVCLRGIAQDAFMPRAIAVELMRQATLALAYVHEASDERGPMHIVHCDVSPSNLFVTYDGRLVLIDFGIAQSTLETRQHAIWPGKLSYMSPEQLMRGSVDGRADLFSLGVICWELTLRRRLFRGPASEVAARIREAAVPRPRDLDPSYPAALEAVVMRLLARNPAERFATAREAFAALSDAALLAQLGVPANAIATYMQQLVDGDGAATTDWQEVGEPDQAVARALGVETGELQRLRTPIPAAPASGGVLRPVRPRPVVPPTIVAATDSANPADAEPRRTHSSAQSFRKRMPTRAPATLLSAEWMFVGLLVVLLSLGLYVLLRLS